MCHERHCNLFYCATLYRLQYSKKKDILIMKFHWFLFTLLSIKTTLLNADLIPMNKGEENYWANSYLVSYTVYDKFGKRVTIPHTILITCNASNQPDSQKLWEDVIRCPFKENKTYCEQIYNIKKDFPYEGVLSHPNSCNAKIIFESLHRTIDIPASSYGEQFPMHYIAGSM